MYQQKSQINKSVPNKIIKLEFHVFVSEKSKQVLTILYFHITNLLFLHNFLGATDILIVHSMIFV